MTLLNNMMKKRTFNIAKSGMYSRGDVIKSKFRGFMLEMN